MGKYQLAKYRFKTVKEESEGENTEKTDSSDKYESYLIDVIAERFINSMQVLWKFMYEIGGLAEATTHRNWISMPLLINEIIERNNQRSSEDQKITEIGLELVFKDEEGNEEKKEIKLDIYEHEHLKLLTNHTKYYSVALKILNESGLQQLVNIQEKLIADIVKWRLNNRLTRKGKKELEKQVISFKDILDYDSLEELKSHIIDNKVTDILSDELSDQIKFISDEFGINYGSQFSRLDEVREALLIRHAIVHSGGTVTSVFQKKLKNISSKSFDYQLNEQIDINTTYVLKTWSLILSFGVILIHSITRNYARSISSKDLEDSADTFLINAAVEAISQERYDSAREILEYARGLKLSSDPNSWIVDINLSQVYKWMGMEEKFKDVINSRKWDEIGPKYQVCIAALEKNFEKLEQLLPVAKKQRYISYLNICEWPLFKEIKHIDQFKELVKDVYGKSINDKSDKIKPEVLDLNYKDTLEKLTRIYQSQTDKSI